MFGILPLIMQMFHGGANNRSPWQGLDQSGSQQPNPMQQLFGGGGGSNPYHDFFNQERTPGEQPGLGGILASLMRNKNPGANTGGGNPIFNAARGPFGLF